ncbi:MAG: hypothetical protein ACOC44_14910 [Promethearchaeia archaeon]
MKCNTYICSSASAVSAQKYCFPRSRDDRKDLVTIPYYNGDQELFTCQHSQNLRDLIKEYLKVWKLEKIPQGDQFPAPELPRVWILPITVKRDKNR